jgi:hypothetical protein
LAAFNAAFDAARTGEPARVMAARADAIDELLNRYFLALTAQDPSQPQVL